MNIEENFNSQKAMIEWLMEKGNMHFVQAMVIVGHMENGSTLCCAWHNYMFPETIENESALYKQEEKKECYDTTSVQNPDGTWSLNVSVRS